MTSEQMRTFRAAVKARREWKAIRGPRSGAKSYAHRLELACWEAFGITDEVFDAAVCGQASVRIHRAIARWSSSP